MSFAARAALARVTRKNGAVAAAGALASQSQRRVGNPVTPSIGASTGSAPSVQLAGDRSDFDVTIRSGRREAGVRHVEYWIVVGPVKRELELELPIIPPGQPTAMR